ncbi:hypothetical protein ARMGADRAFT_1088630 [Armillaria gallica]|uniref:Uncharacterized protein n=1 Tax=Armillaria gallica TaxID=47427 RepID=A0A2H3CQN6_ARMGA|nr:hypothetical protein ARMGADRAFT_1088630 [Armillaria gallica]
MVLRRFVCAPVSSSQSRELNANRSYECVDNTAWQILSDLLESSLVGWKSGRRLGFTKGDIGPERNNEDRQLSRLRASNSADAAFNLTLPARLKHPFLISPKHIIMQRTTDSLSKENEHLSKIISELKEERDKFRQQAGKTRQELSQLLCEKERVDCENADLKRTLLCEKERVDCENADLKRTVLGLEERLKDSLIAHSEVPKASTAAESPIEAQFQTLSSPEQDPSTDIFPSKQEELPIDQVPASNSQSRGTIEEAPTLPNTSPTETTTASTTAQITVPDTTASSKLVLPSPSKPIGESAQISPTANVSTPVKSSTSTSRCCGGQSSCCSPLAHAPPLRSALTTFARERGIPTSSSHRITYGSPPYLKRGYQESAVISPPKKRRI